MSLLNKTVDVPLAVSFNEVQAPRSAEKTALSAESNLLGSVTVFGKRVTVTAGGPTEVQVPGVGSVRLDLSKTSTTSRTAAATALQLKVSVNPLKLNVAEAGLAEKCASEKLLPSPPRQRHRLIQRLQEPIHRRPVPYRQP